VGYYPTITLGAISVETPRGVFDVRAIPYGPQMKKRLLSKHEVENKKIESVQKKQDEPIWTILLS
jgi:hypothetical protein